MTKKIIYDLGSNNGDDIPYYLKKADLVVAVEANPSLCVDIERRFSSEIRERKLFVESCVLTPDDSKPEVFFYLHKRDHVYSQFPKPDEAIIEEFEKKLLPSKSISSLIEKYGDPYYIKIDIEHYEAAILEALFRSNIRPPFISAESHSIDVFAILVASGSYNSFKLVDGHTVSKKFKNLSISVGGRREIYSFPYHSAGPFGEDVPGEWMSANNFFRLLAYEQLGWKDIHATNQVLPNLSLIPSLRPYVKRAIKRKVMHKFPFMRKFWRNDEEDSL